jgi:hypothetical protein
MQKVRLCQNSPNQQFLASLMLPYGVFNQPANQAPRRRRVTSPPTGAAGPHLRDAVVGHTPQPGIDPMSLSLFSSCGDAGLCPGQDWVDEFDGGGSVVLGAVLAGFPDRVGVVPGAFDGARVGALAALVEVLRAGDLGGDAFERLPLIRGEKPGR